MMNSVSKEISLQDNFSQHLFLTKCNRIFTGSILRTADVQINRYQVSQIQRYRAANQPDTNLREYVRYFLEKLIQVLIAEGGRSFQIQFQ